MILDKKELIKLIKEAKKQHIKEFAPLALAAGEAALGTAAAGTAAGAGTAAAGTAAGAAGTGLAAEISPAIMSLLKDLLTKIVADKVAEKNPNLAPLVQIIKAIVDKK